MTKKSLSILFTILIITIFATPALSQWSMDIRHQMEIPEVINLESSATHLYVLSESEGLVVFRAHSDSLQWLYSSTGMQQRGNVLESDIRFAYLYGNGRRLTVVEPTSVLGVYSSTLLPNRPRSAKRVGNYLYIALGDRGLGSLSLESPESVDSDVTYIDENRFRGRSVNDLTASENQILYVLSNSNLIDIYSIVAEDESAIIDHEEQVQIDRTTQRIFLTASELFGSNRDGDIFLINSDGRTTPIAKVDYPVEKLESWGDRIVVRTTNSELWIGTPGEELTLWRTDDRAGNYFTVTENNLWVSEFNKLAPVVERQGSSNQGRDNGNGILTLADIPNVTLPFPRPLIMPLELESSVDAEVTFSYNASFTNATIRGNSFYWQPTATQTGRHQVEIVATSTDGQSDSKTFTIDLRPFNSPPRFTPTRPMTIPVGEAFQIDIKAVDPDGTNPNLVRYLGVDMPGGARLNERSGLFTWNPNIRQVGTHRFQVVATDQYGAAASQDFEIRVVEIAEDEDEELIDEEF